MQRLLHNSSWLLGGTFFSTLLGLVGTAVKARDLGVATFGLFAVVATYVAIIEEVASLRSWVPLIKFGAEAKMSGDRAKLVGYVKLSFRLDLIGAVAGFFLSVICAFAFSKFHKWGEEFFWLAVIASTQILFNCTGGSIGVLRVFDRFKIFTVRTVLQAIVALIGSIIVWWLGWGIRGYVAVTAATAILGYMWMLVSAYQILKEENLLSLWGSAALSNQSEYVRFAVWTHLSTLVSIPFKHFDIMVLSLLTSLDNVGVFQIIKKWANLMIVFTDPVHQAVFPQFAHLVSGGGAKSALRYAAKIGVLITLVFLPIASGLAGTSYWWLGLLYGSEFQFGWKVLALFLILKVVASPTMVLDALYISVGYVRSNMWISFGTSVIYLGLMWPAVFALGLYGAVLSWFMAIVFSASIKAWRLHAEQVYKMPPPGGMVPNSLVTGGE